MNLTELCHYVKFIIEKKIIDPDTYIWPKEQPICDGQLSIYDLEVLENGK